MQKLQQRRLSRCTPHEHPWAVHIHLLRMAFGQQTVPCVARKAMDPTLRTEHCRSTIFASFTLARDTKNTRYGFEQVGERFFVSIFPIVVLLVFHMQAVPCTIRSKFDMLIDKYEQILVRSKTGKQGIRLTYVLNVHKRTLRSYLRGNEWIKFREDHHLKAGDKDHFDFRRSGYIRAYGLRYADRRINRYGNLTCIHQILWLVVLCNNCFSNILTFCLLF